MAVQPSMAASELLDPCWRAATPFVTLTAGSRFLGEVVRLSVTNELEYHVSEAYQVGDLNGVKASVSLGLTPSLSSFLRSFQTRNQWLLPRPTLLNLSTRHAFQTVQPGSSLLFELQCYPICTPYGRKDEEQKPGGYR